MRAATLERVLQRDGVDHGGEHAHVIAGDTIDSLCGAADAAKDVAAADHDRDLHAHLLHDDDFVGDARERFGIDAVFALAHERFAGKFEKDATVTRIHETGLYQNSMRHGARGSCLIAHAPCLFFYFIYEATSAAKSSPRFSMPSPSLKRVKRVTTYLQPCSFACLETYCATVDLSSRMYGCSSRHASP